LRAPTPVLVVPFDSLDCAESLVCEGKKNIAVLNMANADVPGGSYFDGAGAQEEALCRRSTLFMTLHGQRNFYPIPAHGAIYSPDVLILRKSDQDNCAILLPSERFWTSFISVAAIVRPRLKRTGDDFADREDRKETKERIRTLFRVAVFESRKNLVLGALGCGAFRNPPEAVAELFKEVLTEGEFVGRFEGIWFAIIERAGSQNFEVFKGILDGLRVA
jgi:uncharacterized protein (TIGR02452 family)